MTQEDIVLLAASAIEAAGLRYMLVGSFASNYHGKPRMTQDADVVIDADLDGVLDLVRRLEPDFYVSVAAARDAVALRRLFNAIHFDTAFKVDLVVKKRRAFSDTELSRSVRARFAGGHIMIASAEDTVLSKLEWARRANSERQFDDAIGVLAVQGERIDQHYLSDWGADLKILDLIDAARRGEPFPREE